MAEHGLGPNWGMMYYYMKYLKAKYDWLEDLD